MASAYPTVAVEQISMPTPIVIESRHSVRKPAPDQALVKVRKLTRAETERIGSYGYNKILEETGSEALAMDFKMAMLSISSGSQSNK